ncbi:MAG: tetratricopeptide repeat protein, partial [Alphaproteobacteria bacterium]|nr:tetratricopeptide repeat protein [Alphaproteobacteria bacterium]
ALASVLQKQGRLDEALSFYEKYKDNMMVLAQIGLIYAQKGQADWATSAFQKVIETDKSIAEAFIGLAILAQKQNDFEKGENVLLQAPQTPDVLYQLAVLYRHKGQLQKALDSIDKALNRLKNHVYLNEKGLILENLGQEDKALELYLSATNSNAYYADAFANQGNIYLKKGQEDLAEDAYKRAINLDNRFFMAHHNLATLLYRQGRKYEALDHYQEAVIIDPKNMSAVYNLGVIQEDVGEYSEAAGLYFNALVGGFDNPALEFRIASVLERLFKSSKDGKKQALDFVKGWVKHFPDSVVALHTLTALTGKKSSTDASVAEAYAKKLYDVFATEYDEKMEKLEASALDEILKIVSEKQFKKVLDLACGTGAFGKKLKQNFNLLIGVDISQNMLDIAHITGVYDKLICSSVSEYLKSSTDTYDLIVALELTGYLDNLSDLLQGVKSHLAPDGMFIFSIEYPTDKNDTELSTNGRYLYSLDFAQSALEKAGFKTVEIKEINLRREETGYAKGAVLVATPQ